MEGDSEQKCCACCAELRFKIKALEDICLHLPEHVDYQREIAEARAKKEKKIRQQKANLKTKAEVLEEDCDVELHPTHQVPKELLDLACAGSKKHWFRKMTKRCNYSQTLYIWQECFKCGIKMDKVGFV